MLMYFHTIDLHSMRRAALFLAMSQVRNKYERTHSPPHNNNICTRKLKSCSACKFENYVTRENEPYRHTHHGGNNVNNAIIWIGKWRKKYRNMMERTGLVGCIICMAVHYEKIIIYKHCIRTFTIDKGSIWNLLAPANREMFEMLS